MNLDIAPALPPGNNPVNPPSKKVIRKLRRIKRRKIGTA